MAYNAKAKLYFSRLYRAQLSYADFFLQFSKAKPNEAEICEAKQNRGYYTLGSTQNPRRLRRLVQRVFCITIIFETQCDAWIERHFRARQERMAVGYVSFIQKCSSTIASSTMRGVPLSKTVCDLKLLDKTKVKVTASFSKFSNVRLSYWLSTKDLSLF